MHCIESIAARRWPAVSAGLSLGLAPAASRVGPAGHRSHRLRSWSWWASLALAAALGGCSLPVLRPPAPPAPVVVPPPPAPPVTPVPPTDALPPARPAPGPGAPVRARDWDDFREIAARRIVQASPCRTYLGVPPEPLLAIPVLEVELNRDGSVRRIQVLRQPGQARDTVQLAIDAVHRAAPYGDIAHLPRPWKFTEVFLFDDDRRFKPRTLDR